MTALAHRRCVLAALAILVLLTPAALPARGSTDPVYRVPDQALVDIIDAPKTPRLSISPTREWGLLISRPGYPSIAELSEPELKLAGRRIKPDSYSPSRVWPDNKLEFVRVEDLERRPVTGLPADPRISNTSWSPDGGRIAFTNTTRNGVELWVAEVATGAARRLTGPIVSLTMGVAPSWLRDSARLVCCLVETGTDRGSAPEAPRVPGGPVVQESIGAEAPGRTYQDLLKDSVRRAAVRQVLHVAARARRGRRRPRQAHRRARRSCGTSRSVAGRALPAGAVRCTGPTRTPCPPTGSRSSSRCGTSEGTPVHTVATTILSARRSPSPAEAPTRVRGASTGAPTRRRRSAGPRRWTAATPESEAEYRDRLYTLDAPFDGDPAELITLGLRYSEIHVGSRRSGHR